MIDTLSLSRLAETIEARKNSDPNISYVAKLLHSGQDVILKKVAEEAAELLLASKDGEKLHITNEMADLWFHCLVLLVHHDLRLDDVFNELQRREGVSGIEEKMSRKITEK